MGPPTRNIIEVITLDSDEDEDTIGHTEPSPQIRCYSCALLVVDDAKSRCEHVLNPHMSAEHGVVLSSLSELEGNPENYMKFICLHHRCFPKQTPSHQPTETLRRSKRLRGRNPSEFTRSIDVSTTYHQETEAREEPEEPEPRRQRRSSSRRQSIQSDGNNSHHHKCNLCGRECSSLLALHGHARKEHRGTLVAYCVTCEIRIEKTGRVRKHLVTEHLRKCFFCRACDYSGSYYDIGSMKRHLRVKHGGRAKYDDKRDEVRGEIKQLEEQLIVRKVAAATTDLSTNSTLNQGRSHRNSCTYDQSEPSGGITRANSTLSSTWDVSKRSNASALGRFQCNVCNKEFGSKAGLSLHRSKKHNLRTQYFCTTCMKKLGGDISYATGHLCRYHMPLKNFYCGVCAKSYNWERDVKTHINKKHAAIGDILSKDLLYKEKMKQVGDNIIINLADTGGQIPEYLTSARDG